MKKTLFLTAAAATLLLSSLAFAADKPGISVQTLTTTTDTVTAVDMKTRVVTLKDAKGKSFSVTCGPQVKNLAQVKAGDTVSVGYYESLALQVHKAEGKAPVTATKVVGKAAPGQLPAGVVTQQVSMTATITQIAADKSHVVVTGAGGKAETIKVQDPKNLANVKVGDKVTLTYTEALAVAVNKPAAKK